MSERTPKVSVMTSERVRYSAPTSSSTGMTNQSLPYASANSTSSMRARSAGPASTEPKFTCASSNSQKRNAGMPVKLTGEGMAVQGTSVGGGSVAAFLSDTSFESKAYQSKRPPTYSDAVSTRSPSPRRAPTEKAYSMRSADHDAFSTPGSLKNASYQSIQLCAAFSTSATSPPAIGRSEGSTTLLPGDGRSVA